MDLETKVGQLFFVGFEGTADGPALRDYLAAVRPGGVVLFARNIVDADQVRALNDAVQDALDPPPFIAVDQEGGRVSRLRAILPALPPAAEVARWDTSRIRSYGQALGEALRWLGFNTDFAPVVDLSAPGAPSGIGDRSFGEDPEHVRRCAAAFIEGLSRAGVASFLKHFPGLGATDLDSHVALPVCARPPAEMWDRDLLPFRACASQAAGVMIAHVHCPWLDTESPVAATLSRRAVDGLLRERMGYDGIALTDDLEMGAVAGPSPEALARSALVAGNDMVMFCNSESQARAAVRGILEDTRSGAWSEGRIDRSLERILFAKRRFGIAAATVAKGEGPGRAGSSGTPRPWSDTLAALTPYASVS